VKPSTARTAVKPEVKRKGGGMRRWMFLEPYWSDIEGQRFLTRFVIIFCPWFGLHVTRIHMADNQREMPHDHTRTFWSLKMGWYDEDVFTDPDDLNRWHRVCHRRFGIHKLRYDQAHKITAVSPRLWTILFLGRHRQGSGYWTPDGKQSLGMPVDEQL
jgi:hypothetical protein